MRSEVMREDCVVRGVDRDGGCQHDEQCCQKCGSVMIDCGVEPTSGSSACRDIGGGRHVDCCSDVIHEPGIGGGHLVLDEEAGLVTFGPRAFRCLSRKCARSIPCGVDLGLGSGTEFLPSGAKWSIPGQAY